MAFYDSDKDNNTLGNQKINWFGKHIVVRIGGWEWGRRYDSYFSANNNLHGYGGLTVWSLGEVFYTRHGVKRQNGNGIMKLGEDLFFMQRPLCTTLMYKRRGSGVWGIYLDLRKWGGQVEHSLAFLEGGGGANSSLLLCGHAALL